MRIFSSKKNSAAFGLLDLIVLLSISSIILALSVPQIHAFSQAGKLRNESRRLKSTLKSLTVASLQHQDDVALTLYSDEYVITYPAGSSDFSTNSHRLHHTIAIDLGSLTERKIVFYKGGVNSPASIKLTTGTSYCTIIISLRGRVRSEC